MVWIKIHWEKDSWKRLSLIGDETVINLQSTKVYVFSDSVWCLGKILQHPDSNEAWKNRIAGVKAEKSYRDYDGINGESIEFELSELGQTPETFTGRILFMSMFNDISCDRKGYKEECLANARVIKVVSRKFGVAQWSFVGPGSYIVHKELGIMSRTNCCWNSQTADILLPVQRLHCPGVFSKAKDMENCRYILLLILQHLRPFFA